MKQDHIIQAELEARQACEGLNYTEKQIKDFIDWHVNNEMERAMQRAKDLERPKRAVALTNALINIAVDPWRELYAHKDFPKDTTPACSTGCDAEYAEEARLDRSDRTKECNR